MELVLAFRSNELTTNITIIQKNDKPLFRASDVSHALGISNVRCAVKDFKENEKVGVLTDTLGGPQNVTFLTQRGLYRILMQSKKKIALDFQYWVAGVLEEIQEKGRYELENKLTEQEVKLKEKEEELAKFQKRNKIKYDNRHRVYVYEDITNSGDLVYKVGFSTNMTERTVTYDTHRFENKLKFETACVNGRLLESVVHHILRRYQDCEKTEWFHTELELIIKVIKTAKHVLDDLITDESYDDAIDQNVDRLCQKIANNADVMNEIIDEQKDEIEQVEEQKETKLDRFFEECCIANEEFQVTSWDAYAMYRKWNNNCTKDEKTIFINYLKQKYKYIRIWNSDSKMKEAGFRGFKIDERKLKYEPDDEPNIYDKYVLDRCYINLRARTSLYVIHNDFKKWLEKHTSHDSNEVKKLTLDLRKHLGKHFIIVGGSFIYNGKMDSNGVYGVCLKEEQNFKTYTTRDSKCKPVYKINPLDNSVVGEYTSLTEVSGVLKNDMYYKVKNGVKHTDGFLYSYTKPTIF